MFPSQNRLRKTSSFVGYNEIWYLVIVEIFWKIEQMKWAQVGHASKFLQIITFKPCQIIFLV